MMFAKTAMIAVLIVTGAQAAAAQGQSATMAIITDTLPELNLRNEYRLQLQAIGGAPPYRWSIVSGNLPEGILLDPNTGVLSGVPTAAGDARFTVQATDSASPAKTVTKEFTLPVVAAIVFEWTKPPQVQTNRIEGAVRVTNGSKSDYDLTVVVVGVNEIGRATALGYQHFKLKANSVSPEIEFGTTLPRGSYTVHADAIAEVAEKRLIMKEQLESANPLKILVGP